jgi:hypothetical protein
MSNASDYFENKLVDWLFRGQSFAPPATGFIAAYTVAPTDSTPGTEVSGGAYARISVPASLANWAGTQAAASTVASSGTGGQTSNNILLSFPAATAAWGTVVALAYLDASTGGNMLCYAPLGSNKTVNSGDTLTIPAGQLTWTVA